VTANMATTTEYGISNSQHKTGVNGHFRDAGKGTKDNFRRNQTNVYVLLT